MNRHSHTIARIAFALVLMLLCAGTEWHQALSQVKEPPIPVIIGKGQAKTPTSDAQSIVMSVADFDYLIAREDSLRQTIAKQNEVLRKDSRSRSFLIYALVLGLVLSNVASIGIVSKRLGTRKK